MAALDGYFTVRCCGRRRGILPSGVLICLVCDAPLPAAINGAGMAGIGDVPLNINRLHIPGDPAPA